MFSMPALAAGQGDSPRLSAFRLSLRGRIIPGSASSLILCTFGPGGEAYKKRVNICVNDNVFNDFYNPAEIFVCLAVK